MRPALSGIQFFAKFKFDGRCNGIADFAPHWCACRNRCVLSVESPVLAAILGQGHFGRVLYRPANRHCLLRLGKASLYTRRCRRALASGFTQKTQPALKELKMEN